MKPTIGICICATLILSHCATNKPLPENQIPDTLIDCEQGDRSADEIKDQYQMVDLVSALPEPWEIRFPNRAPYLEALYKERIPEDFIEVPEEGAQCKFTVIRLDRDLVAVTTHSDMGTDDSLRILRRVPSAWQDITSQAFPYALHKVSRIHGHRDRSLIVGGSKFVWNGSSYIKE
ncbi:MAG: hypothetical protein IPK22_26805 [Verrucomicrobiaceae bacterium]|nr:hypothetical protein [Verrucomicrobiaceae bacterium]